MDEVKLNRIDTVISKSQYPTTRTALLDDYRNLTLMLAIGEERFGDVLGRSNQESFSSMNDVICEVMQLLPRHAVGEPYQAEGEG